jgi:hypothetical protein
VTFIKVAQEENVWPSHSHHFDSYMEQDKTRTLLEDHIHAVGLEKNVMVINYKGF